MGTQADKGYMDRKRIYPAAIQPLGSINGYPASGWFSMHITYPDTAYADETDPGATGGFQYGQNTQSWRQGLQVIIKTCMASAGASSTPVQSTSDTTNVVIVDLAAYSLANGGGYSLGSEEAARVIASKINSTRFRQVSERGVTRMLKARYVKMSSQEEIEGVCHTAPATDRLRIQLKDLFIDGAPPDLPPSGEFTVNTGGAEPGDTIDTTHSPAHSPVAGRTYTYDSWRIVRGPIREQPEYVSGPMHPGLLFSVLHEVTPMIELIGITDKELGTTMDTTTLVEQVTVYGSSKQITSLSIKAQPPQHTVVITWNHNGGDGYWAGANGGPVIQGLGQTLPVWHLVAKPLDGGNMGLPALNYDARGGAAVAHTENHGFCRFSIEGLNSAVMPSMPPPDFTIVEPAISGMTAANPGMFIDSAGNYQLNIAKMEYGTQLPTSRAVEANPNEIHNITLYEGPIIVESNTPTSNQLSNGDGFDAILDVSNNPNAVQSLLDSDASENYSIFNTFEPKYSQPFYVRRKINEARVEGMMITNEEMVFEDLEVIDDAGNSLTVKGGSPFGTIIRDFVVENVSIDEATGEEIIGPSTGSGRVTPNLRIQLPDASEIPGGIFVRSAHDRIQAHSNKTWGMGGINAPTSQVAGYHENTFMDRVQEIHGTGGVPQPTDTIQAAVEQGEVTQFDTHDRMLLFHCERILHPDMTSKQGLSSSITPGAVPSGTTRLYSAHRISDHAERGSVLPMTANGDKTITAFNVPHSRLRFGRQGHSFVTPLTHRGTPHGMRRQLHRSHGSAYTLMFEAETENKHHIFQQATPPTSGALDSRFAIDSIELKGVSGYAGATGSGSADALPLEEMTIGHGREGRTDWVAANQGHSRENATGFQIDYLIAPGQTLTNVDGPYQQLRFGRPESDLSVAGISSAVHLHLTGPASNGIAQNFGYRSRSTTAAEAMVNGFILSDYQLSGGRPQPSTTRMQIRDGADIRYETNNYTVVGSEWGWVTPRVATELATVPPMFVHDPDYTNMQSMANLVWDKGIINEKDTNSGAKPDAFLCHWLAEYGHPAITGSAREHFMMFRYREAGMPRAMQYPAVRGLLLRNHSRLSLIEERNHPIYDDVFYNGSISVTKLVDESNTLGEIRYAKPFERIYALQWLQSYGFNGLNAGGHGVGTLESGSSVLMGHTTVREPRGTMKLPTIYSGERYSRGESIGDSINPEKGAFGRYIAKRISTTPEKHRHYVGLQPMVGFDHGRRLPVRAWGIRTASDALDMLAGDPHETLTYQNPIYGKARYDGGMHDSVALAATNAGYGWETSGLSGVERSSPIGMVISGHTVEAMKGISVSRLSNEPITSNEDEPLGIGRAFDYASAGLFKPISLPAGMWTNEYIAGTHTTLAQIPTISKGSDPIIPSNDETGTGQDSPATVQTSGFGSTYHLVGNSLHTNSNDLITNLGGGGSYPANGWGYGSDISANKILPTPLAEIADHRQVISRVEPRMGLIIRTTREEETQKNTDYLVTSTKAVSLHSDLIIGQQFPVTPSYLNRLQTATSMHTRGTLTTPISLTQPAITMSDLYDTPPTFEIDGNRSKGLPPGNDTTKTTPRSGAEDIWNVRGGADLPPWGGVYILRKTFLNRQKEGSLSTVNNYSAINNTIKATASHPQRQYVDYIVRPFRPYKMYAFASQVRNQDGYLLGPHTVDTGVVTQPSDNFFHRDKRYGIFELNMDKEVGMIEPILSASDSFGIDWPDPNDFDVVYHLIPSTSLLEFFKSDANRIDSDNQIMQVIEPRYSQSTHPGGFEEVSQSETRYSDSNTGIAGDHAIQRPQQESVRKQYIDGNRNTNRVEIKLDYQSGANRFFVVRDASMLPNDGDLVFPNYAGSIRYTAKNGNILSIDTNATTSPLLASASLPAGHEWPNKVVYYTKKVSGTNTTNALNRYPLTTGAKVDISTDMNKKYPLLPSFIDNSIVTSAYITESWYRNDDVGFTRTGVSYRGVTYYTPQDFIMMTQRPFQLLDGASQGVVNAKKRSNTLLRDGRELNTGFVPPYLYDADNKKWRVSEIKEEFNGKTLVFKNMEGDTLTDSGVEIGDVFLGQYATVGVRTTDAVMTLLNDGASSSAGFNLKEPNMLASTQSSSSIGGHPSFKDVLMHSNSFISRNTRGLNILEVIRNSSQLDGNQLINISSGILIYSSQVFRQTGKRIGADSGARDVSVSRMFDSPNVVTVKGDKIAENETVLVEVKDVERMKLQAGAGAEENVVRSFTQEVPGLKTNKNALRLAKSLLARIENGAPLIQIMGLVNATSVQPGDVITVNLPVHGLNGLFAVFETTHNYEDGTSDFVVAQYEKGIEGILSDLQSNIGNASGNEEVTASSSMSIALSSSAKIVVVHRIVARSNNNTKMTIGHRASATDRKGAIGVQGGNRRALPIGMSKSRPYVVK